MDESILGAPEAVKAYHEDVEPAFKKAQETFKSVCGGELTIAIVAGAGAMTRSDVIAAKHIADDISENIAHACPDEGSKAAMRKMTTLNIAKAPGESEDVTLSGSTVTAYVNDVWSNDLQSICHTLGNHHLDAGGSSIVPGKAQIDTVLNDVKQVEKTEQEVKNISNSVKGIFGL